MLRRESVCGMEIIMGKHINCDKLIIAVLQGNDYLVAIDNLNAKGFYVTILSSTGGFLKKKNVTLMIGVNHEHLNEAITILKQYGDRVELQQYPATITFGSSGIPSAAMSNIQPIKIPVHCGGVVLFVLDVQQNERF